MTHSQIAIPLSPAHGMPGRILRTGTHSDGGIHGVGLSLMESSRHFETWRAAAELACGHGPHVSFDGRILDWAQSDHMQDLFLGFISWRRINPAQLATWIDEMARQGDIPKPFPFGPRPSASSKLRRPPPLFSTHWPKLAT